MMPLRIDVYTIFPAMIESYCDATVLGRAQRDGLLAITALDVRSGATDQRGTVDDTPFGGGAGMVMKPEPIIRTIRARESAVGSARPLIAVVPHGQPFTQQTAERLSGLESFSILCGRYEGIDQRVLDNEVDEVISLGDFVLAGGELAALAIIEATARLVPGVLGNDHSVVDESFSQGILEYPQWTKPASVEGQEVPEILLSGDHGRVARWRHVEALRRTLRLRPDLIAARGGLRAEEQAWLEEFPEVEQGPESD